MAVDECVWDRLLRRLFLMRALFLFLAKQEGFKNLAMRLGVFRRAALRFVAGESLDDAIRAVRQANRQNMTGTLDLLGENTLTREDAVHACAEIIGIFDRILAEQVCCNVSVKLTQLGLALDPELSRRHLFQIAKHAREKGSFVRVDMEDSPYTQHTLEIVADAHEKLGNVGTVIQSYLYRSEQDTLRLLDRGIGIRLVKGAYLEPESVAFRKKRDTDANFIKLMKILLTSKPYHAIATHDESILSATKEFARAQEISKDHFEFQMLYGIRRDLQFRLAQEGYNVRIYIPYGRRWYSYFMRRLAERPSNVAFVARNLFKG
jgi:proline dehydrogenase